MKFVAGGIVGFMVGFVWALLTEPTPDSSALAERKREARRRRTFSGDVTAE